MLRFSIHKANICNHPTYTASKTGQLNINKAKQKLRHKNTHTHKKASNTKTECLNCTKQMIHYCISRMEN